MSSISPDDLFRSIDLELDESIDPVLSSPVKGRVNRGEEEEEEAESIPREIIASEVRSTRFLAALERPIRLGTFNDYTAFLLTFRFSFQRVLDGYFKRVRAVDIEITFDDAPRDQTVGAGKNPSIVRFHPVEYNGPVTQGMVTYSSGINSDLSSVPGGPSVGAHLSREVNIPIESSLKVHGTRDGRPRRNKIIWTIEEDRIRETGLPREVKMSLMINMNDARRFSARVVVAAHYMFKKGILAKQFPVIGRTNDPLFFDPPLLQDMARTKQTGPDGAPIAEIVGKLDANFLEGSEYSSFPGPAQA
ncbi:hypothetical protein MMC29_005860 [Sticta canariensis]|nr:hypothetical protein [Sticta canariensis]